MKFLGSVVKSEWLKTKHTSIRYMIVGLPIVYAVLLFGYIKMTEKSLGNQVGATSYTLFFELLNMALIVVAAIVVALHIEQEFQSDKFNHLLSSTHRIKELVGKELFFCLILAICILLSTAMFALLHHLFLPMTTAWMIQLFQAAFVQIVCHWVNVIIYMVIGFTLGIVGNVSVSIFGVISAIVLGGSSLGTGIWYFLPFTWGIKGMYLVQAASQGVLKLIVLSVLVGTLLTFCMAVWFRKWEGRRQH